MDDSLRPGLACVGTFAKVRHANERALVVAAMGLPYWIFPEGARYHLYVEQCHAQKAATELSFYEAERRANPFRSIRTLGRAARGSPSISLFVFTWFMAGVFLLQQRGPAWLLPAGELSSQAIAHSEWWRLVTALTLHADLAHLAANLATGLMFAFFLLPMFGTGFTWSAILLSGVLGNLFNVLFYRGEPHTSIGASTAVFGALGILVGAQLAAQVTDRKKPSLWELILPLGAGAALLAYLGVGDKGQSVDFMAHFWGMLAGVPLGVLGQLSQVKRRLPAILQHFMAIAALLLPVLAWVVAIAHQSL